MHQIPLPICDTAIIILGASGDLAKKKLIPALSNLYSKRLIDDSSVIMGSGRTPYDNEQFRARFKNIADEFKKLLHYHVGLKGLKDALCDFRKGKKPFRRIIFFMALPPEVYVQTTEEIYHEGFRGKEVILIIEKPFGYDYTSARKLNQQLTHYYSEEQIFRIDHYLGKEAVQNILIFRFANSIFYPIWNNNYIQSIQINAFEDFGVEDRGIYFDKAGLIRDMVQNHLTQLLCLLTMEAPVSLEPEDIRHQKINILKALRYTDCYRAQYEGYTSEKGILPHSRTETYAELILYIDTFRWNNVPIHIRAGKALYRKTTEIGVQFRPIPKLLFNAKGDIKPNTIIFKIQPAAGIIVDLASKEPGDELRITDTSMMFCYSNTFKGEIPEAYQKLLLDALRGDHTLFVTAEETELSWKKVEPVLNCDQLDIYKKGTMPQTQFIKDLVDFDDFKHICT
jgi:glucose-6-phosphate 1-dehydrogenase